MEQRFPTDSRPADQARDPKLRLIRSALEVFARDGYEGASLRTITAHAGLGHGAVKYYFGNKLDLWKAAVSFMLEERDAFINLPPDEAAKLSARERVRRELTNMVHYAAQHPEQIRILINESMAHDERLQWLAETHLRETELAVVRRVESLQKDGVFPKMPALNFYYIMIAATRGVFALAPVIKRIHGI
ncbi:MAG: TetR/AcrR family transcriptional regulator, partial [Alphaproteobacteria bacterium]|nr:TetR/AcrR family transcriptional regulator [Alphaproteobacteria bacterium]